MPRLENWSVVEMGDTKHLSGQVFDHPHLEDGEKVFTSRVQSLDLKLMKAITRHSDYTLGDPEPLWLTFLRDHCKNINDYGIEE